jgi:hypothetical protein
MLHSTVDNAFPPSSTTLYGETLAAAGRADRGLAVFTQSRAGHCEFNPVHFVGVVRAMQSWLDTGVRPSREDEDFFPTRDGFASGFTPGPWPE